MSGKRQIPRNKTKAYINELELAHSNKKPPQPRDKKGRFAVSGGVGPKEPVAEDRNKPLPGYLKDIGFLL